MLNNELLNAVLQFRRDRAWEQFHTPQNLAVAISVEAGELLEHFQWMTPGEKRPSQDGREAIELEIADIAILLSYLAHDLEIDMDTAVQKKLALNALRYSVEKSRGNALKYDRL